MLLRHNLVPAFSAALVVLGACGEANGPDSVAGQYTATTFRVVESGNTTDVLAAGGALTITLTANGTTTGQLVVPAAVTGGSALIASMEGTYTLTNGVVTFSQLEDTFVRDMPFTVQGRTLTGSMTFSGATVSVVLTRT